MRSAESDSNDCIGAPKNRGPLAAVGALGCSLVSLVLNPALVKSRDTSQQLYNLMTMRACLSSRDDTVRLCATKRDSRNFGGLCMRGDECRTQKESRSMKCSRRKEKRDANCFSFCGTSSPDHYRVFALDHIGGFPSPRPPPRMKILGANTVQVSVVMEVKVEVASDKKLFM